jgi:hypothetical protein
MPTPEPNGEGPRAAPNLNYLLGKRRETMSSSIRPTDENDPHGAWSKIYTHPDNLAVDKFSAVMKAKLEKKRAEGRGGWEDKSQCSAETLSQLLREHLEKGDPVDVANLAMMLHQRGERIL